MHIFIQHIQNKTTCPVLSETVTYTFQDKHVLLWLNFPYFSCDFYGIYRVLSDFECITQCKRCKTPWIHIKHRFGKKWTCFSLNNRSSTVCGQKYQNSIKFVWKSLITNFMFSLSRSLIYLSLSFLDTHQKNVQNIIIIFQNMCFLRILEIIHSIFTYTD